MTTINHSSFLPMVISHSSPTVLKVVAVVAPLGNGHPKLTQKEEIRCPFATLVTIITMATPRREGTII